MVKRKSGVSQREEVGDVSHIAEVGGKRRLGVDDGEERVMAPMDGMRAEI